jgi:hypothetical protein
VFGGKAKLAGVWVNDRDVAAYVARQPNKLIGWFVYTSLGQCGYAEPNWVSEEGFATREEAAGIGDIAARTHRKRQPGSRLIDSVVPMFRQFGLCFSDRVFVAEHCVIVRFTIVGAAAGATARAAVFFGGRPRRRTPLLPF